tara:strand:- start:252 stop:494 length:243 start_codon:yes stop_codon:yes gene_type:complete
VALNAPNGILVFVDGVGRKPQFRLVAFHFMASSAEFVGRCSLKSKRSDSCQRNDHRSDERNGKFASWYWFLHTSAILVGS